MAEQLKNNEIRVLAVRQPWASLIVEGFKTLEVRSRDTKIRGKIAIYSSWKVDNVQRDLFTNLIYRMQALHIISWEEREKIEMIRTQHGRIIGTVEVIATEEIDKKHFYDVPYVNNHLCVPMEKDPDPEYYWKLSNPVKFETPIRYNPPKGAIVWSKTELPEGY